MAQISIESLILLELGKQNPDLLTIELLEAELVLAPDPNDDDTFLSCFMAEGGVATVITIQ